MKIVNNTNNNSQLTVQLASSMLGTTIFANTSQTFNASELPPNSTSVSIWPAAMNDGIHGWYYTNIDNDQCVTFSVEIKDPVEEVGREI